MQRHTLVSADRARVQRVGRPFGCLFSAMVTGGHVMIGGNTVTGGYILIGGDAVTGGYITMGGDSVTGGYIMMGGDRVAGGYIMIGSYTVTCGFIMKDGDSVTGGYIMIAGDTVHRWLQYDRQSGHTARGTQGGTRQGSGDRPYRGGDL